MLDDENKLDPEIERLIFKKVYEYHDEKYEEMDSIYRLTEEASREVHKSNDKVHKRLDAIQEMIHSHSSGVQNVYNKFTELEKKMLSDQVVTLLRKMIKKIFNCFKSLNDQDIGILSKVIKSLKDEGKTADQILGEINTAITEKDFSHGNCKDIPGTVRPNKN
jgi:uncharacterized coiled-coil DUF342 family protein